MPRRAGRKTPGGDIMPQPAPMFRKAMRAKRRRGAASRIFSYGTWLQRIIALLGSIDTDLQAQTAKPTYPRPAPPGYQDPVLNSLASILATLQSFKNCDSGGQSTGFPSSSDNSKLMLQYTVEILLELERKCNADGTCSSGWTAPRYDTTQSAAPAMPHPDFMDNSAPNYNNDNWYRFISLYVQQITVEANKKRPAATVEERPIDSGGNKAFDDHTVIEYCLNQLTKLCDKTDKTKGKT